MNDSFSFDSLEELLNHAESIGIEPDVPKATKSQKQSVSARALENFEKVMAFVEANGREPIKANLAERTLAIYLQSERTRPELKEQLLPYDRLGLLSGKPAETEQEKEISKPVEPVSKSFASMEELLASAVSMGMMDDIEDDVLSMTHVKTYAEQKRNSADEIAVRTRCEDFANYEKLFVDMQRKLDGGKVQTTRTISENVEVGRFFILRGMLCYVEKVVEESKADSQRFNQRMRVIFQNATEIEILQRSFARALQKDKGGKAIIPESTDFELNEKGAKYITKDDKAKGWIYILATESTSPALAQYKNTGKLVKIGYTTQTVEERIANAEKEATYLNAPVKLLAKYECFNMNVHQFEGLIHAFLHGVRLNMTVMSKATGRKHKAKEWFRIDVQTAMKVCEHIIQGDIHKYRMDNVNAILVER